MSTAPFSEDLALAHRLADAADRLTRDGFRSESLQVEYKGDGTPVTEVDRAVEQAMGALVAAERPGDALLGEEIGAVGDPDAHRRWIFDGIDGTHNYAAGRPGWGTMICLTIDGEPAVGVISAPANGVRYWGARGHGSWTATLDERGTDGLGEATRLACRSITDLDSAVVVSSPPPNILLGWRSDAAARFHRDDVERHRSFALDVAVIGEGHHDAMIILVGGPWDYAANVVIIEEAGGEFRSAYGDRRLDTTTAVFGPRLVVDHVVETLADLLPAEPDEPVRANRL